MLKKDALVIINKQNKSQGSQNVKVFEGEVTKNGKKKCGEGKVWHEGKVVYEGTFFNGKKNGIGKYH